jgi:hypothetical protein
LPHLDERARRLVAASEALQLGYGGISIVSRASGISRVTITKAVQELNDAALPPGCLRRPGAGRPKLVARDPDLPRVLESLVEPVTRGDPESPLRWTCKSTRSLAAELADQNHPASHMKVHQLLRQMNYSLQSNRKTEEGQDHVDRDAQFLHINQVVQRALAKENPVISVDTKKKELIGNYANKGRQWRKKQSPELANGHDFADRSVPRAYPYGAFAVASIRGWWRSEGRKLYPKTDQLVITADGGGSNGYRLRLWKMQMQKFADETRLVINVCHFPPGTSKWNKVEHRLFSFISSNWRGEPLRDYETVVRLIAATTTAKGLKVSCRLDRRKYAVGRKVTDEEFAQINLRPHKFHGEWNYTILPNQSPRQL